MANALCWCLWFMCYQMLIIIGLTHVLVVFRVIATLLLAENSSWPVINENSQTVALMLGAVLHYITITIMTRVNSTNLPLFSENR